MNIPPTSDAFTFKLQVRWLNTSNGTISTTLIKTYTTPTGNWDQATARLVAPAGAASAQVRMVVSSLNATIYVDDFVFRPRAACYRSSLSKAKTATHYPSSVIPKTRYEAMLR